MHWGMLNVKSLSPSVIWKELIGKVWNDLRQILYRLYRLTVVVVIVVVVVLAIVVVVLIVALVIVV